MTSGEIVEKKNVGAGDRGGLDGDRHRLIVRGRDPRVSGVACGGGWRSSAWA
jgi:hypothetical protein